jgi:hypothetical protein
MWESRRLTTLWTSTAWYRDSLFTFTLVQKMNDQLHAPAVLPTGEQLLTWNHTRDVVSAVPPASLCQDPPLLVAVCR